MGSDLCPRAGRWIGGCRFEARFDVGAPAVKLPLGVAPGEVLWVPSEQVAALHASKPQTYVRDVCVRCGRTIERQPTERGDG